MSAQYCGCDPEAKHLCGMHLKFFESQQNSAGIVKAIDRSIVNEVPAPAPWSLEDSLRSRFPHGHPKFLPTTLKEIQLHSDKNHDYAKGGSPLGNFERVSAILALYPNLKLSDPRVLAMTYALKQVDAFLWGLNSGIKHKVEGAVERLQDVSVYAKIIICMCLDLEGK